MDSILSRDEWQRPFFTPRGEEFIPIPKSILCRTATFFLPVGIYNLSWAAAGLQCNLSTHSSLQLTEHLGLLSWCTFRHEAQACDMTTEKPVIHVRCFRRSCVALAEDKLCTDRWVNLRAILRGASLRWLVMRKRITLAIRLLITNQQAVR